MSTVNEIIEAVKKLPERDKSEFLERLTEVDFDDAWDRQIEADAKAVPRMIPRLTPAFRDQAAGGFSMNLYLKHREYNALLGAVAMTAGLMVKMNFFCN